jgi:hypothetical protein
VQFSPEAESGMTTYMSYVQDREEVSDDTDIFNLVIDSDNNVKNGVYGRPVLTSHDYEGSTKSIKTDATLNRKVLSFTGGGKYPSVYNLPISYLQPLFSDGFSYEIMFKVDDGVFNYSTKSYVGILDMEEAGGWGLNLYRGATADKPVLYAEVAYATTWNSLKYTINTNEWYHCVYSFDGTNIALYINGVEVLTATVSGDYRAPSFSNGANPYICIGGCAQAVTEGVSPTEKSTGMNGFAGDIAKIKIMTNPVTYEEARAMAKAEGMDRSNDPILDLVIGDDNSVTNGSFSRNELASTDYTGSVKQVVTSAELARKVLSFSRGEGYRDATASTYNIAASEYNSLFADGFTLEVMFNVDSSITGTVGIVDYVEAGGWGLIASKSSNAGKAILEVEFKHGGAWTEPTYEINTETWYHFVMVYDGNGNLTMYLNGVKNDAMSKTGLGAWNAPSFSGSQGGREYICIGGLATAWSDVDGDGDANWDDTDRSTGTKAFVGEIAKVKILPDAVSAKEARDMAKAEGLDDTNDPILDLVINNDGSVKNNAPDGVNVTLVDYAGSYADIIEDTDLARKVLHFGRESSYVEDEPATINMAASTLENDFADGFAVEVMFKVNSVNFSSSYVGVVDHEEAGGWGMNLYKSSEANKAVLKAEFAYASTWNEIAYTVNVGEWYHMVMVYDGSTVSLYVNGELIKTDTLSGAYRAPNFGNNNYICIGACAQQWRGDGGGAATGKSGFIGDIADVNIYESPVTAQQVAEMYQKAIA